MKTRTSGLNATKTLFHDCFPLQVGLYSFSSPLHSLFLSTLVYSNPLLLILGNRARIRVRPGGTLGPKFHEALTFRTL